MIRKAKRCVKRAAGYLCRTESQGDEERESWHVNRGNQDMQSTLHGLKLFNVAKRFQFRGFFPFKYVISLIGYGKLLVETTLATTLVLHRFDQGLRKSVPMRP